MCSFSGIQLGAFSLGHPKKPFQANKKAARETGKWEPRQARAAQGEGGSQSVNAGVARVGHGHQLPSPSGHQTLYNNPRWGRTVLWPS